ncbi:hypothetical protein CPB86DRAFT_281322 [Serendipita vermifera]|nr:hypothetical protein CPB86DRAFT_281322 [Serendipita vermifera]
MLSLVVLPPEVCTIMTLRTRMITMTLTITTLMEGAGEVGDDPSYSPTSRSSPLPPGLPAYTSHTSTAQERGRPKTPYPFPSVDKEDASPNKSRSNSNNQPSQPSDSNRRHRKQSDPLHTSSSSPPPSLTTNPRSRSHSRTRPKGRRRHTKSISDPYAPTTTTTSDVQPRIDHIQAPDQQAELPNPNPLPSSSQRIRSEFFRRRGRIPNSAISRTKRITILVLRLLLGGAVLGGWAAYSCARYWLAYSVPPDFCQPERRSAKEPVCVCARHHLHSSDWTPL